MPPPGAFTAVPSGRGFQNASAHILVMENSVSRLTPSAAATSTNCSMPSPALIRTSLPKNPERGGTPGQGERRHQEQHRDSHGWAR